MKKIWNRHEEKLMKEGLFKRRFIILSDEYFDSHKVDPQSFYYSYFTVDIIDIDLKKSSEKLFKGLIEVMTNNQNVDYRRRYLEVFRIWAYRLDIKQEKIILSFLRKTIPENRIYEVFDNRNKIDYYASEAACHYYRKPYMTTGTKVPMVNDLQSEEKLEVLEYSNYKLDYRFNYEVKAREDYLIKKDVAIRCLSIKGYQKAKCKKFIEWNGVTPQMLRICPILNNLD